MSDCNSEALAGCTDPVISVINTAALVPYLRWRNSDAARGTADCPRPDESGRLALQGRCCPSLCRPSGAGIHRYGGLAQRADRRQREVTPCEQCRKHTGQIQPIDRTRLLVCGCVVDRDENGTHVIRVIIAYRQGCARLIFSGCFDSDSYDNPGDSTPTQLKSQICFPDSTLTQLKIQIYY